ncbi:glycosyltransferase family 1 protein [Arsenicitalea aurantiaca]|uniref:Glycosyltransferase family 1 protein n=1 Tax=Arsenicitalea aurantiaca TaxID=1783274 RepID=A0A433XEX4_9HYPH|nr:glycosyltransferase family 4 protein [Arsenicitalea aurantiaca]RUT32554.1 glycosyltransferase family 1 protein [Arsenicitalea aurantiaca]
MQGGLRILQILRAPVGGLFRHVSDLTYALAERGHTLGIVADSLTSDDLTESRLEGLRPAATLGIHRIAMPRLAGINDISAALGIRRLADRLGVDVLHGHGAKGGLNARLARLGARRRVALYTPHGGVLNYAPGLMTGRLFRLVERGLTGVTDAIIFESHFAQRAFAEQIGEARCLTPVVHNGLQPSEFNPPPLAADPVDFVFIGEFRPVKGIPYLLEALATIKRPDGRPPRLAMAGGGPDFDAITALIGDLGLSEQVELAGVRPAREMLARGHCVVVPSLAESLPYVVLEAAAAGRQVIATRVGGIDEIFGPTADRLVPPAKAAALARAMQAYLDAPEAAASEIAMRLDHVRAGFSFDRMADSIESLYHDTVLRRRQS